MRSRTITSWETLSWYNECGCVWSEVVEKLNEDVKSEKAVVGKLVVCKSKNTVENGLRRLVKI